MANWDRKYNHPLTLGAAYTVTITCPAGWRPKTATRPNLTASPIGTVPAESYQMLYEKVGSSALMDDVWKLGTRTYQGGNPRYPWVSLQHASTPPPTNPITEDRPAIRDGNGSGASRGSGFGTIVVELPLKDKAHIRVDLQDFLVTLIKGPIPEPPEDDKKKKKAVTKKRKARK